MDWAALTCLVTSLSLGFSAPVSQGADEAGTDTEGDGVEDSRDNCIDEPNGPLIRDPGGNSQFDTDGDGFGNLCDPDFNDNDIVDPSDFSLLKSVFGSTTAPDQDLNCNGIVDPSDFSRLKVFFGEPPGPSGFAP